MLPKLARAVTMALVTWSLVSLPAAAQENAAPLVQRGDSLELTTLGHAFTLPLPDWLGDTADQSDTLSRLRAHFVADEQRATLEIYPQGESQGFWTQRYGIQVLLDPEPDLMDFRRRLVVNTARGCQPSRTGFFQLGEDEGPTLPPLGFVCGAYRSQADQGRGEIMVMSFRQFEDGIAVLFHEWRGDDFDPGEPDTWPVVADVVQSRAWALQDESLLAVAE